MKPWIIFAFVLGPMAAFAVWIVMAELRGRFRHAEPERIEPDFLQRHAMLFGILLVLGFGFVTGGIFGFLASLIVFLVLSSTAALIMTAVEGSRDRSLRRRLKEAGDAAQPPMAPFPRRLLRNFRSAITELPSYWG